MSPTGYTAPIADGIDFKDFIMQCARAFGALVTMRDEPMDAEIPEEFKPSDWHKDKLAEAEADYEKYKAMGLEEATVASKEEYQDELDHRKESIRKDGELKGKYLSMLAKVKAWQPPTPDHQGLKDFMVKQIEESIDFDCNHDDFYKRHPVVLKPAKEWLADKINFCLRDIAYHTREMQAEEQRCAERTAWVQALRKSLS